MLERPVMEVPLAVLLQERLEQVCAVAEGVQVGTVARRLAVRPSVSVLLSPSEEEALR